jgi:hypothetical protein
MILVPSKGPESWRELLADPEKHWREGKSAQALATAWERASGFPDEISKLFATVPTLAGIQPLLAIPEHKVPLPGGSRASQTDLWVLARTDADLLSIAVEGKVRESFGPTIGEWMAGESTGKSVRWSALCELLGLASDCDRGLRYQLVHRTASALIEARRFHAGKAVLVVHSFSSNQDGFTDFQAFVGQLGGGMGEVGRLQSLGDRGGIELFVGWTQG